MSSPKTAVVTGATGTIGSAIASKLLEKKYDLVMVVRNREKADKLFSELTYGHRDRKITVELTDLADREAVLNLKCKITHPIDVLINNAAVTPRKRLENKDKVEMQWAVNVLGYFRMINVFKDQLKKGEKPRIVNVASYWAGGLDLTDPEFKKRRYDNDAAYRQSKQANRMLSKAFSDKLKSEGIAVNSCHPGDANSNLSNDLGFGGHESPEAAAETPVWLATDNAGYENTGKYFEHKRSLNCHFCQNNELVEKLFRLCESYG